MRSKLREKLKAVRQTAVRPGAGVDTVPPRPVEDLEEDGEHGAESVSSDERPSPTLVAGVRVDPPAKTKVSKEKRKGGPPLQAIMGATKDITTMSLNNQIIKKALDTASKFKSEKKRKKTKQSQSKTGEEPRQRKGQEEEEEEEEESDGRWSDCELERLFRQLECERLGERKRRRGSGSSDEEKVSRSPGKRDEYAHPAHPRADGAGGCSGRASCGRSGDRRHKGTELLPDVHQTSIPAGSQRTAGDAHHRGNFGSFKKRRSCASGRRVVRQIHGSASESGGCLLEHSEVHGTPLEESSAANSALILASRKHSRLVDKVQGKTGGKWSTWPRQKGQGRGEWDSGYAGAGKGKKGKGKGKSKQDRSWGAKGNGSPTQDWEKTKEKPDATK